MLVEGFVHVYAGRYSLNRRGLRDSQIHPIGYDPHPPTSSPPTPSRDVMPECEGVLGSPIFAAAALETPPGTLLTLVADSAYLHVASTRLQI